MKFRLNRFTVLSVSVAALIAAMPALARDGVDSSIELIRKRMYSLDKENKHLASESARLKTKLIGLQMAVEASEKEYNELKILYPDKPWQEIERNGGYNEAMSRLKNLGIEDPFVREAQEIYAEGLRLDLPADQNLRELFLFDLQYKKQELELDLTDLQVMYSHIKDERQQALDEINNEIERVIGKEKALREEGAKMQAEILGFPQTIELMKVENERLKDQIKWLRSEARK